MQTGFTKYDTFPVDTTFTYPVGVHVEQNQVVSIPLGRDKRLNITSDVNQRDMMILNLQFTNASGRGGQMIAKSVVRYGSHSALRLRPGDPLPKYEVEYFGLDDCVVFKTRKNMLRLRGPMKNEGWMNFIEKINTKEYEALRGQAEERAKRLEGEKSTSEETEEEGPGFRDVRLNVDAADFTIICQDEVSIPVHTAILCTFWPFFKNMMSNDCIEKTTRQLRLDFPSSWVNQLIVHIYKEEPKMTFDEATGVLIASQMYLLPELTAEASRQLKGFVNDADADTNLSLEDLLTGWDRSVEANNAVWRRRFAMMIATRDGEERRKALEPWEKQKLMELYFDTAANLE